MNVNFPNQEPVVVRENELRVVRRLPGGGDVKIRAGERIGPAHVLARTDPKSAAVKISVADQLGVSPQEVVKLLLKPVGSAYAAGEALARNRKGLRNVVVAAPISGTLLSVDQDTGMASIAPNDAGEFRSMVAGDIEFIDGKHSVSIRTVGSRLYGIVGVGPTASGRIQVAHDDPAAELPVDGITPELAGKIVVGGAWASAAAIKKLAEIGAVGLITGGFVDREIGGVVGVSAEDRLAPWRMRPSEQVIAEEVNPGLALMATEGFGKLAMHAEAFGLLKEQEGRQAILFTATRVVGYLARPQLIVVHDELLDDDAPSTAAALNPGTLARLVDQGSLGQHVVIAGGPKRARRGDGNLVDVIDVATPNGNVRTVPLANVEILA